MSADGDMIKCDLCGKVVTAGAAVKNWGLVVHADGTSEDYCVTCTAK